MSLNFNKCILAGRLTADPELKATPSGIPVITFTVEVNRQKPKDGGEQQADFINCVAWRSTAEFITNYFSKGSAIMIVGAIQVRSWTDQSGQKRYTTEVIASEAHFVESKSSAGAAAPTNYQPTVAAPSVPEGNYIEIGPEDDLPF